MPKAVELFQGGTPIDPQAEADLERWAFSQPRFDLEPEPAPVGDGPGFLGGGDIQADYFGEIADERRSRQDDLLELARLER